MPYNASTIPTGHPLLIAEMYFQISPDFSKSLNFFSTVLRHAFLGKPIRWPLWNSDYHCMVQTATELSLFLKYDLATATSEAHYPTIFRRPVVCSYIYIYIIGFFFNMEVWNVLIRVIRVEHCQLKGQSY